ncbi:MAG: 3'-5' exonuclease [Flavobacteriia bacterium]|nr:3'-5' exonuclease [Flavobacteriia bacterium]
MLANIPLKNVLFLDIETVPQVYRFSELSDKAKSLFQLKNRNKFSDLYKENKANELDLSDEDLWDKVYQNVSGIQAEFGKIICISVGFVKENHTFSEIRLKSFFHDDEETLLKLFIRLLNDNPNFSILCGHNAKEFDFPYICRRLLINGLNLPPQLDISGKKPWEIAHIDTMDLWKFGDFKAYTSLSLLCHVFDIPTPKDDISGQDVARVYYEENNLLRIKQYCEKDVLALAQLLLRMKSLPLISDENIHFSQNT